MNKYLLEHISDLFDKAEKWDAFLNLYKRKDDIINQYYSKLMVAMNNRFNRDRVEGWSYVCNGIYEYRWYITDFDVKSVYVCIDFPNESVRFSLWADTQYHNLPNINKELQTEKFAVLRDTIERVDSFIRPELDGELIAERGNFKFDSPYDSQFDYETLSWYAGNKTEELVDQIARKVDRIRRNDQVTRLLVELNELSLRN